MAFTEAFSKFEMLKLAKELNDALQCSSQMLLSHIALAAYRLIG